MKTYALLLFGMFASFPTAQAGTISFFADGIIDQALGGGYPFVDAGDSFRLSISYSDGWPDMEPASNVGGYRPDDLSVTLEIPGEGVVFQSIGGSVNVSLDPGEFPAVTIISTLGGSNTFVLVFRDDDRSSILDDSLPTSFGQITDYDSVGFSVVDFDLGGLWNPIDGTATSITSIPEPHTLALAAVGLTVLLRLRRGRQQPNVEPDASPEPPPRAASSEPHD